MKCPLMSAKVVGDKGDRFIMGNCVRRECVAWDSEWKYCRLFGEPPKNWTPPKTITTATLRTILALIDQGSVKEAIVLLQNEIKRVGG